MYTFSSIFVDIQSYSLAFVIFYQDNRFIITFDCIIRCTKVPKVLNIFSFRKVSFKISFFFFNVAMRFFLTWFQILYWASFIGFVFKSRSFHKFLPNSLTDAWFVPPRGFCYSYRYRWSNVSLSLGKNDSSENFCIGFSAKHLVSA